MKCLILGGGGFVGAHLCEALVAGGHAVTVFERPRVQRVLPPEIDSRLTWVEGDFTNSRDLEAVVADSEVIFHLVSTTLPKNSNDNPIYDVESNLVGTLRLLDLVRAGPKKRIVFASSGGTVYGRPSVVPISEGHETDPICSYGIHKLAIEKYLNLYRALYGLDYVVLRLANPFGERQRHVAAQGVIPVFLHKAMQGESIEIWGDGGVVRDYVYIKDAIRAFVRAMDHAGQPRIFNVGSGRGLSLNDILDQAERLLGRPIERVYQPARKFDVPVNVLDISLARVHLGWRPQVSFEEGLANTYRWMLDHI